MKIISNNLYVDDTLKINDEYGTMTIRKQISPARWDVVGGYSITGGIHSCCGELQILGMYDYNHLFRVPNDVWIISLLFGLKRFSGNVRIHKGDDVGLILGSVFKSTKGSGSYDGGTFLEALLEFGFEKTTDIINANSGNRITLINYALTPNKLSKAMEQYGMYIISS